MTNSVKALDLALLAEVTLLSSAFGTILANAAAVCLEDQKHNQGVLLTAIGQYKEEVRIVWPPSDDPMRRTWNDDEVATEYGAYAIAIMLMRHFTGKQVIERSKKGNGFDFWLNNADHTDYPFQKSTRLEVSGIRSDASLVDPRYRQKCKQISKYKSESERYVIIIEFSTPIAKTGRVE